jgi:hypothetical protein
MSKYPVLNKATTPQSSLIGIEPSPTRPVLEAGGPKPSPRRVKGEEHNKNGAKIHYFIPKRVV